ncbi:MAG: sugar phosphate isomerase/epimerase [Verrucomicrobia bacterium]|nr:sugar phosphate isomerase/epimerase [Verrucomicrobiota bacterium]
MSALSAAAAPIPADAKINGFAVGCQAYTFNRFSLFEAIEKTAAAGGKVIEFYPGQSLTAEDKLAKKNPWNHDASDEVIARVKEKLAKHGVRAVNYGVVTIPKDEAGARKIFEFARKMSFQGVTTESVDNLDLIEKLVKEYDIRVGIHQHAKRFKKERDTQGNLVEDTTYKVWSPEYVRDQVAKRDRRIGACADLGHWQTSGLKALDCVKILEGRIMSVHMKERAALGTGQHDTIFGTGITDMGAILAELKRQKFDGNIAIEYEFNWDNSVPDVKQCVDFVRSWKAK